MKAKIGTPIGKNKYPLGFHGKVKNIKLLFFVLWVFTHFLFFSEDITQQISKQGTPYYT